MKNVWTRLVMLTACTILPFAGCVVHDHDYHHDPGYYHHDDVRYVPPPEHHDDSIHVDVHP